MFPHESRFQARVGCCDVHTTAQATICVVVGVQLLNLTRMRANNVAMDFVATPFKGQRAADKLCRYLFHLKLTRSVRYRRPLRVRE